MSERSPRSNGPAPKSKRSGEHPAVQAYRAKLKSVDEGVTAATSQLDRALQAFLADMKTPVPSEPEQDQKSRGAQ